METSDGAVLTDRIDIFDNYNGKTLSVDVKGVFELKDGKIHDWREYFDTRVLAPASWGPDSFDPEGDQAAIRTPAGKFSASLSQSGLRRAGSPRPPSSPVARQWPPRSPASAAPTLPRPSPSALVRCRPASST
jgi:hypothetical protein